MKLEPVTKFHKRNSVTLKKIDDNAKLANYEVIVFISIYDQFEAIRKPDSERVVYKT